MNTMQEHTPHRARKSAAPAKPKPAAAKPRKSGREALLAKVEAVRLAQRQEGHFDCFATATGGYCDQGGCLYHSDCLSISAQLT